MNATATKLNLLNLKINTIIYQETLSQILKTNGWVEHSLGQYRSNGKIKEKKGFKLYIRTRSLKTFIDDFSKKASSSKSAKPHKIEGSTWGSGSPMGNPTGDLTPPSDNESLPILSSFSEYTSLKAIATNRPCLLIGFDSEWQSLDFGRDMISWQYALVDDNNLTEFIFLKDGSKNLNFFDALGCILDCLNKYKPIDVRSVRKYKYCSAWENDKPVVSVSDSSKIALKNCRYVYRPDHGFTKELIQDMPDKHLNRSDRDWAWFHQYLDFSDVETIHVSLVCHTGRVDLSSLEYGKTKVLRHLTNVQGGVVSLQPIRYTPRSFKNVNNRFVYPISLSVSDTLCHAPAKKRKLEDLGNVLGIPKINIPSDWKLHMKDFFNRDPIQFMEYASRDSVVTLLYASSVYGYNNALPVTITSVSANVMKENMMNYLHCKNSTDFDLVYRGLKKVNHGKFKLEDRPGFVEATNLEPISNNANTVQFFASQAYHGGYNICSEIGYFPFETYDYDLQNAYPTAMCLVPDIDWTNPIRNEIIRRDMNLGDFAGVGGINPITPFVGYVRFKFPDNCKFPCIPIKVDGIPQYPLSSEGLDGVYVAGPFIWLALKLGATVYCDRGYFLNTLFVKDYSHESRSLASAVKQLVMDRNLAKLNKGKGSLEELILKTIVNSGYGKTGQNVIQKSSWSALKDIMTDLGCSAITNPVSAMMITSIVQVELLAAQNQIHNLGYMSCSVTTDGFISNCPMDVLKTLNLYGLRTFMESARLFLTGNDPELWEIKHKQDDLINFCTRGNVSLRCKERDGYDGVCAHNSSKSGFEPDSYNDRLWLMTKVLSRTGPIEYNDSEWTSFKDLVHDKPFVVKSITRRIRMDFDMKRKPIKGSFYTEKVVVCNHEYEIAHFDTAPFNNIEEFRLYRKKKELCDVLRTLSDWEIFWLKIKTNATGAQPKDLEWSILNSCIMGYRCGRWDIPSLNNKTVKEKCDWINTHNTSSKKFKPSDWKNARRPERQANMLPFEMIEEKLKELIATN